MELSLAEKTHLLTSHGQCVEPRNLQTGQLKGLASELQLQSSAFELFVHQVG